MGIYLNTVFLSCIPDGYLPAWQCRCWFIILTSLSGTVLYMMPRRRLPPRVFRRQQGCHRSRHPRGQGLWGSRRTLWHPCCARWWQASVHGQAGARMIWAAFCPLGFAIQGDWGRGLQPLIFISGHRPWHSNQSDCKSDWTETIRCKTRDGEIYGISSIDFPIHLFVRVLQEVLFRPLQGCGRLKLQSLTLTLLLLR